MEVVGGYFLLSSTDVRNQFGDLLVQAGDGRVHQRETSLPAEKYLGMCMVN
jgi:hypothetical protein